MNEDKLEIEVRDIYNILDTEGNLDGYSLGYYVGNEPYGYAIYSIKLSSIREFVFCSGVENLYNELEDKAEYDNDVNEDDLINGIVYDGGIDYRIYDKDGNEISVLDEESSITELEQEQIDDVLSLYDKSALTYSSIYDNFDLFQLCSDNAKKWTDIESTENVSRYNIIKDVGLAMISQEYYKKNVKKYCCEVSSVTGCLSWMGRLYNGSIFDTYNKFWKDCKVSSSKGEDGIEYGGSSVYLADDALNKYFKVLGIPTRAKATDKITFNKCVQAIDCTDKKEGAPFLFDITSVGDGSGHSVIGVSYYQTTEHNYLGIFNNWYLDSNDSNCNNQENVGGVSSSSSFNSVRYIDFDELKSSREWTLDAMFFSDVRSANIKEAKTEYASGNKIELSCYVPIGTTSVYFPTWTVVNGQDDLIWYDGTVSGGKGKISIDVSNHGNAGGNYITHIYAYDKYNNLISNTGTSLSITNRASITNAKVSNVTSTGYTISFYAPTGAATILLPTWTFADGQDDI